MKGFFRFRNMVRNGLWPTSVYNLGVGVAFLSSSLASDAKVLAPINKRVWSLADQLHISRGIPYYLRLFIVSSGGGIVFFVLLMFTRRWMLRILLSYRGWMYEPLHRPSWYTKTWGFIVWMVSGYHPITFSYQNSLPHLCVPPLNSTIDRFLLSVKPLHKEDSLEYRSLIQDAEDFRTDLGPRLQRFLVLKSWWSPNWVTDWWEKYVYLSNRSPLSINSNYYVLDNSLWCPTDRQISRAASTIYQYMKCKRMIDHESLPPILIRNTIPLCMAQYERLFSTTRVPGTDVDVLLKFDVSKHVAVLRRGIYYRLDLHDCCGRPLLPQTLEKQLEWIVADADQHFSEYSQFERSLAALTAIDRTEWAQIRMTYFANGVNRESLDVLESAVFHVNLETKSFDSWSERGKYLLHGDGSSIWFDKSFNAIFFSDGKMGLNAEHSWGDAPIMGHISEYNLTNEILQHLYQSDGFVEPVTSIQQDALITPLRLHWNIPVVLELAIDRAVQFNQKNNEDLDLVVVEHKDYGKGFIKTCKVSPDGYLQMALQLAYFKDSGGKLALTYESSMTRLFLLGRTETIRSLTTEAADFIHSMADKSRSNDERIALLRKACERHQVLCREAMSGKGIDRHLFGLYVLSKGFGYENNFLKNALMMPWTLSTSQQPQQQIQTSPDCNNPAFRDKLCPGGGFGPVSDKGYGISYMFPGDWSLYFHISSKKSTRETDSKRFVSLLFESLREMKLLFQTPTSQQKCGGQS